MFLTTFVLGCVFSAIVILLQGVYVITRNPRASISRWWFALSVFVGLWCLLFGVGVGTTDYSTARWLIYASNAVAYIGIGPTYVGFALSLIPNSSKYLPLLYLSFLLSTVAIILLAGGYALDVVPFAPFHFYERAKIGDLPHLVNVTVLPTIIILIVLIEARRNIGQKRNQLLYFALASVVGFITGDSGFLPAYGIEIFPYTMYLFWLYPLIITYAIVRHRLMDISVVIRKSLVYSITIAIASGLLFLGVYLLGLRLTEGLSRYSSAVTVVVLIVIGMLFNPLRKSVERLLDRFFGRARYEYLKALEELGREVVSDKDSDTTIERISKRLTQLVGARHGRVEIIPNA